MKIKKAPLKELFLWIYLEIILEAIFFLWISFKIFIKDVTKTIPMAKEHDIRKVSIPFENAARGFSFMILYIV